jgi:hypothetical protein
MAIKSLGRDLSAYGGLLDTAFDDTQNGPADVICRTMSRLLIDQQLGCPNRVVDLVEIQIQDLFHEPLTH